MKAFSRMALIGVCLAAWVGVARAADTKATVSQMHICCEACTKGINKAVAGVEGVKAEVDADAKTATLSGSDADVKKAIAALAAAGFHGAVDAKGLAMKDDSGAKDSKVAKLTCEGAHNCCGACTKAIKAAAGKVEGVKTVDCKPKAASFTVEGDFNAKALVKALNDAGFHVTVK